MRFLIIFTLHQLLYTSKILNCKNTGAPSVYLNMDAVSNASLDHEAQPDNEPRFCKTQTFLMELVGTPSAQKSTISPMPLAHSEKNISLRRIKGGHTGIRKLLQRRVGRKDARKNLHHSHQSRSNAGELNGAWKSWMRHCCIGKERTRMC